MAFLDWDEKYRLGVDEMDKQHMKWLEILNSFYDNANGGSTKEKVTKLLKEAIDYTNFHFLEEEKLMERIKYPRLDNQKQRHKEIQAHLNEYYKKLQENKVVISLPITAEMKSWFNDHILHEDKGYGEFMKKM